MNKLSFVVVSPMPFTTQWGGVCALYQLAEALARRGEVVEVLIEKDRDKIGTLAVAPGVVTILPELYRSNPVGSGNVVRWILNKPELSGCGHDYGDDELLFLWSEAYRYPSKSEHAGLLFTAYGSGDTACGAERSGLHPFDGVFADRHQQRGGTCYLVRKGKDKPLDKHQSDALNIDDYHERGGNRFLADVFNRCERFICYDHATMLATFAAMCGCEVVVIPDGVRTVEQAVAEDQVHLAGIAWGFDDLPRAAATRGNLQREIIRHSDESEKSIDRFIEICHERFGQ
jgi:hypothetical protein